MRHGPAAPVDSRLWHPEQPAEPGRRLVHRQPVLGPRNTAPGRLRQGPTRTRPEPRMPPPRREALHANLAIKDDAGLATAAICRGPCTASCLPWRPRAACAPTHRASWAAATFHSTNGSTPTGATRTARPGRCAWPNARAGAKQRCASSWLRCHGLGHPHRDRLRRARARRHARETGLCMSPEPPYYCRRRDCAPLCRLDWQ